MTDLERDILENIEKFIQEDKLSNEFLVSNLKLSVQYLNLMRISEYSDEISKSTQGIRKYETDKIINICGYQLIINNQ